MEGLTIEGQHDQIFTLGTLEATWKMDWNEILEEEKAYWLLFLT
jgi:hypothetical protein